MMNIFSWIIIVVGSIVTALCITCRDVNYKKNKEYAVSYFATIVLTSFFCFAVFPYIGYKVFLMIVHLV